MSEDQKVPSDRARKARQARTATRRLAERQMMEQATLRTHHEQLVVAARRVVEAWESAPERVDRALNSACRDLAALLK